MDHAVKQQPASFSDQMREFVSRNLSWFLAIALALLLLQDVFGTHGLVAMRHAQQQAAATQKEIDQLNEANRQMQDRVKSLKSDPAAIEKESLGKKWGLLGPGNIFLSCLRNRTTQPVLRLSPQFPRKSRRRIPTQNLN